VRPIGGRGRISLIRRGSRKIRGGFQDAVAQLPGHHQAHGFPLGNLVAQVVEHSASQLDFKLVRAIALDERGRVEEDRAGLPSAPRHKHAAGVVFVAFDDELIAAEIGAAKPREVVLTTHVNLFEPAGWNAVAILYG
jgi:hypothetical protein